MPILKLQRTSSEQGTISTFKIRESLYFCVEREPKFTEEFPYGIPNNSCIPTGSYQLSPHNGKRYKNTFALVNLGAGVAHWGAQRASKNQRYACVIHPAANSKQLAGCLAFCKGVAFEDDAIILQESTQATLEVLKFIKEKKINVITIRSENEHC